MKTSRSLAVVAGITAVLMAAGGTRAQQPPSQYRIPPVSDLNGAPALAGLQIESDLRFVEKLLFNGRPRFVSDHVGVELRMSWDETGGRGQGTGDRGQGTGDKRCA